MMTHYQTVCTDLIVEFLEVAFNNILYSRKLYPSEAFIQKKIYSTASNFCQHPEVNEYLKNILKAIKTLVTSDPTSGLTVRFNILDNDKFPIEKYIFNIYNVETGRPLEEDPYFLKLEDYMRTICVKLSMATSYLKPLPEESSFMIEAEASQRAYVALSNKNTLFQDFPWMLKTREPIDGRSTALIPLSCIKNDSVGIECFILNNKVLP